MVQRKEILSAELQKEMEEAADHPQSISILWAVDPTDSPSSKPPHQESCDYLLSVFPSLEQPAKRETGWEVGRTNFSAFSERLPREKGQVEELVEEFKECLIWMGNCVLVVGLGLGLLMLVSLMASRQRRSKQSLLKWVVRWAGAEGRKRSLREKEPPLCL